jgi:hypothetical protein
MPTQVEADGTIIPSTDVPSHPGAIPQADGGSPIQAAATSVNNKTETQADAIAVLGAKAGGKRTRRRLANLRRVQKILMRGGDVEVKNVPNMPSAGGVDPKATFAGLLAVQHQGAANRQFDSLGDATPKTMPPPAPGGGGRRRHTKKKTLKHKKNGTRPKHKHLRKHRRSVRRTHHVRDRRRMLLHVRAKNDDSL